MMNVVDLMNLVTLERKVISVLSDHIDAPHAEAGWKAIKNAEAMIAHYQQQDESVWGSTQLTSLPSKQVKSRLSMLFLKVSLRFGA